MKTHLYAWISEPNYIYLKFNKKFLTSENDFVNFLIDIGFEESETKNIFSKYRELFLLNRNVADWFDLEKTRRFHFFLIIGGDSAHMIFQGRKLEAVDRFVDKYFTMVSDKKRIKLKEEKASPVKKRSPRMKRARHTAVKKKRR